MEKTLAVDVVKSSMYEEDYAKVIEDWMPDNVIEQGWEGSVTSVSDGPLNTKIYLEVDLMGTVTVDSITSKIEKEFAFVKYVDVE